MVLAVDIIYVKNILETIEIAALHCLWQGPIDTSLLFSFLKINNQCRNIAAMPGTCLGSHTRNVIQGTFEIGACMECVAGWFLEPWNKAVVD